MEIDISWKSAFSRALVKLGPGEQFVSEAGAMFRASSNMDIDVSTRSANKGGVMAGLKRDLARESFFFSKFTCTGDEEGEVGLAPTLQGEITLIDCDGSCKWMCTGGSHLGSTPGLDIDTEFQGLKGMFTGESMSFIVVTGQGKLLVNAFGHITGLDVVGALTVDTGHVIAFQDSLSYTLSKASSSWIQSFLSGENLVLNFTGRGENICTESQPR